jgi:hypothetical protein
MAALTAALGSNGVTAPFLSGPQQHFAGARFAATGGAVAAGSVVP